MSGSKKKTPAEELIESLLKDVGDVAPEDQLVLSEDKPENTGSQIEGLVLPDVPDDGFKAFSLENSYEEKTENEFESTEIPQVTVNKLDLGVEIDEENLKNIPEAIGALLAEGNKNKSQENPPSLPDFGGPSVDNLDAGPEKTVPLPEVGASTKTEPLNENKDVSLDLPKEDYAAKNGFNLNNSSDQNSSGDGDKTVAVAGYQVRDEDDYGDKVKISVGQNRTGYSAWNNAGSAENNLAQAENLRIAQEKILELERENEKLRLQNEELMAASEIIKERSDLLSAQLNEYKKDRDDLEESFKNEIVILKNHLARKDTELQRAQMKTDELESRLKFDMKKIRVRERELENRLELIRAEKNAIVKNKDEQILDLRRKMDVLQMEVESYRQKCVELNKMIETSQESFKRTTRALRLAMANLELQEENKVPLKKVD